ncbi:MAG: hypothetical protein BMS9Abin12_1514 [Acidimicrobiia bacterium]|nr:MAG: hypothetical protein BMS9Abin12_1514 [Acidimicrobiia bacterium]
MLRELHWAGIVFGAASGLVASFVLFAFSGSLGGNLVTQIIIQSLGFVVAGYVAGRFSLIHGITAGGVAALSLFFIIAAATIAAGAGANIFGLVLLGFLAIFGGSAGAELAERRRHR